MRKNIVHHLVAVAGAVVLAGSAGCLGSAPAGGGGGGAGGGGSGDHGGSGGGGGGGSDANKPDPNLAARVVDYGHALRTAALKLTGELPSMDEIAGVKDAASYAAQIDKYLADARLSRQLLSYFQDMMKMGGSLSAGNQTVSLNTAPTFATEVVVNDRPLTDLFTAGSNTCPTLNTDGTFADKSCAAPNGLTTAGVLTDPGAMAQFYSNMAFRRVRWLQETFDCLKFPAEFSAAPIQKGSGQYVNPWPFESVTGGAGAQVDFQDTKAAICANCHGTMNHLAPLFANFDTAGNYTTSIQVHTPTPKNPLTVIGDWLPPGGQTFAWRFGQPVTSLAELGAKMAGDQAVLKCQVQRAWNWALSKTDIVSDLAVVPETTIDGAWAAFQSNGNKLKPALKAIFTSDDFVKF